MKSPLLSPGAQTQETGYERLLRKQELLRRQEGGVDVRQQGGGRSISPPGVKQSQALCPVPADSRQAFTAWPYHGLWRAHVPCPLTRCMQASSASLLVHALPPS